MLIISFQIYVQRLVDEEELQFHEEYMNEQDPSILHFLLASGDDVWNYLCIVNSWDCFSIINQLIKGNLDLHVGFQQATSWWFNDSPNCWAWNISSSTNMDFLSPVSGLQFYHIIYLPPFFNFFDFFVLVLPVADLLLRIISHQLSIYYVRHDSGKWKQWTM